MAAKVGKKPPIRPCQFARGNWAGMLISDISGAALGRAEQQAGLVVEMFQNVCMEQDLDPPLRLYIFCWNGSVVVLMRDFAKRDELVEALSRRTRAFLACTAVTAQKLPAADGTGAFLGGDDFVGVPFYRGIGFFLEGTGSKAKCGDVEQFLRELGKSELQGGIAVLTFLCVIPLQNGALVWLPKDRTELLQKYILHIQERGGKIKIAGDQFNLVTYQDLLLRADDAERGREVQGRAAESPNRKRKVAAAEAAAAEAGGTAHLEREVQLTQPDAEVRAADDAAGCRIAVQVQASEAECLQEAQTVDTECSQENEEQGADAAAQHHQEAEGAAASERLRDAEARAAEADARAAEAERQRESQAQAAEAAAKRQREAEARAAKAEQQRLVEVKAAEALAEELRREAAEQGQIQSVVDTERNATVLALFTDFCDQLSFTIFLITADAKSRSVFMLGVVVLVCGWALTVSTWFVLIRVWNTRPTYHTEEHAVKYPRCGYVSLIPVTSTEDVVIDDYRMKSYRDIFHTVSLVTDIGGQLAVSLIVELQGWHVPALAKLAQYSSTLLDGSVKMIQSFWPAVHA